MNKYSITTQYSLDYLYLAILYYSMILYVTLMFIGSVVANGLFGKAVTIVQVEADDVEKRRRNP